MSHTESLESNKIAYKGFYEIQLIERELKGKLVTREKLILKDSVGAIVIDEDERIGLVLQKRPVVDQRLWGIPAGVMDKHLSFKETLIEELKEECLIDLSDILSISEDPIYEYYSLPSGSDSKFKLFMVKVRKQQSQVNYEDADVEKIGWFSKEKLVEMLQNKEFIDAKTILSVQHFLLISL